MGKIAFLDFDGTLSSGYISMEFLDAVYRKELYSETHYQKQMDMLKELKNGELSYDTWCEKWGEVWAMGLKEVPCLDVEAEAAAFFSGFKRKIYKFSYSLIDLLKEKGYHTAIVSVGASEVISLAASEIGAEDCYSTVLKSNRGYYTGEVLTDIHAPGGKVKTIERILKSRKRSIAFGDSIGDVGMLEQVEMPVALNPSEELRKEAEARGWSVFTWRNAITGVKKLLE
ncbi:MAG: HAD family phosphatase [Candidatus Woesearchaeota archaeon]